MLLRPAVVTAVAAALAMVPVTAATAQTYRHTDTTKDVRSLDFSSSDLTMKPTPGKEPDVKSIRVNHGKREVTVAMRFVDLTRTATAAEYEVEVRTNEHLLRVVDLIAGPKMWRGRTSFSSGRGPANCYGLGHNVDYASNLVSFTIPRSCLSKPRWVKVAAMAGEVVTTKTSTEIGYFDDAQSSKFGKETWSPRIHMR